MGTSETNSSWKTSTLEEYDASTAFVDARIAKQTTKNSDVFHNVKLAQLPNYAELKRQVDAELAGMTWWESYGIDSLVHFLGVVGAVSSFFLMRSDSALVCFLAVFLLGCCHNILAVKGGHLAAHKAAVQSAPLNRLLGFFFSDVCGTFPSDAGITIHIKEHHPYTNIIGIGDSSTWKMPLIPAYLYMFVTPLLIPAITPFVSVSTLWGQWFKLCRFSVLAAFGLWANLWLLLHVSGCSLWRSLAVMLVSRAVLSVPYIHVNIFQHIGLPMFALKDRPKTIYQMSTGVLNLSRNPVLDYCFGHSIMRWVAAAGT